MMTREQIEATLKTLIIEKLRIENLTAEQLTNDQPLVGGAIEIDSIDVLKLILEIEAAFGVKMVRGEFARGEWRTIGTLAAAIESRMQAAPGEAPRS